MPLEVCCSHTSVKCSKPGSNNRGRATGHCPSQSCQAQHSPDTETAPGLGNCMLDLTTPTRYWQTEYPITLWTPECYYENSGLLVKRKYLICKGKCVLLALNTVPN